MRIRNAILWIFVDTGTINRPLRLRGERGEMWGTINKNNGIAIPTVENRNAILGVFGAWYDVLQNKKYSLKKQKPYFCNAKTYFLHAKNHTFATQKGGF